MWNLNAFHWRDTYSGVVLSFSHSTSSKKRRSRTGESNPGRENNSILGGGDGVEILPKGAYRASHF